MKANDLLSASKVASDIGKAKGLKGKLSAILNFAKTKEGRRLICYIASTLIPDAGILKAIGTVISDENLKEIIGKKEPYSIDEVALISMLAHNKDNKEFLNDDSDDSVIDNYAKYLHNYLYNYKEEATDLDPSIDPSQDQIGIMAQDLEQVNPACVNETPEGVKTVDTGRLALMNAGAIADLARRLKALEVKYAAN